VNTFEQALGKLYGRAPTDAERQELLRMRDAFGIKDNDALWLVLAALRLYETMYAKWPGLIREAAEKTLADVRAAADEQMRAAAEATKQELAEAVARTADQVATETARTRMLRWAAGCATASTAGLALIGWFFYHQGAAAGHARGWDEGYERASDEKAAASWANTPEGQLAYGLAKAGSLRELATCSGRGWVQRGTTCLPKPANGVVTGWHLPAGGSGAGR
jgi:hypothetical protein